MSRKLKKAQIEFFEKLTALYLKELDIFIKTEKLLAGDIFNVMGNMLSNMTVFMYACIGNVFPSDEINYPGLSKAILKKLKQRFEDENKQIRQRNKH